MDLLVAATKFMSPFDPSYSTQYVDCDPDLQSPKDKCHVWRMQSYAHRKKSLNIGYRWQVVRYWNFFYWYNEVPLARWYGPQDSSLLAGGMVSWGEYCDNYTVPIRGT